MHEDDTTTEPRRPGRMRLAAVLGTAVLAIPGGFAIGNAFAADGSGSSSPSTPSTQQQPADSQALPARDEARDQDGGGPDGRDCPKDQGGGGSGSGSGGSGGTTTPDTGTTPSGV